MLCRQVLLESAAAGTIDLHVLPPVTALDGAGIRELTGDDRIPDTAQISLRAFPPPRTSAPSSPAKDRKRGGWGKSVLVRVRLGCGRLNKTKHTKRSRQKENKQ